MPDLLVRDIDPELYERLKKAAEASGKSMAQTVRETLKEKFVPARLSKEEIWARIDALRERIGPVAGDSTAVIREMRERDRSGH